MKVQISSWSMASISPIQGAPGRTRERQRSSPSRAVKKSTDAADKPETEGLAQHLLRAQEAERLRIAVELHDGINQEVAMLSMELGTAIACASEEKLRERLIATRNRAIRISEEIRRISHRLRPALLEYIGFSGAVRRHCRDLSENAGLHVDVVDDDLPDVPTEVATVLYRIGQEALQNVVRHARATAVKVRIQQCDGFISLSVEDNGIGFNRDALPPGCGMGLASMRERARSLGGELTVKSVAAQGTKVAALIPVREAEQ